MTLCRRRSVGAPGTAVLLPDAAGGQRLLAGQASHTDHAALGLHLEGKEYQLQYQTEEDDGHTVGPGDGIHPAQQTLSRVTTSSWWPGDGPSTAPTRSSPPPSIRAAAVQQAPPLTAPEGAACLRPQGAAQRRTSMGQAVAALSAAAGEHLAAISGTHPLTEAVLLGALALFGLIGTEHLHTPPSSQ